MGIRLQYHTRLTLLLLSFFAFGLHVHTSPPVAVVVDEHTLLCGGMTKFEHFEMF